MVGGRRVIPDRTYPMRQQGRVLDEPCIHQLSYRLDLPLPEVGDACARLVGLGVATGSGNGFYRARTEALRDAVEDDPRVVERLGIAEYQADHPDSAARLLSTIPLDALGADGRSIALLWTNTVAFQKLQRYAHDDISLDDYLGFVAARRFVGAPNSHGNLPPRRFLALYVEQRWGRKAGLDYVTGEKSKTPSALGRRIRRFNHGSENAGRARCTAPLPAPAPPARGRARARSGRGAARALQRRPPAPPGARRSPSPTPRRR